MLLVMRHILFGEDWTIFACCNLRRGLHRLIKLTLSFKFLFFPRQDSEVITEASPGMKKDDAFPIDVRGHVGYPLPTSMAQLIS